MAEDGQHAQGFGRDDTTPTPLLRQRGPRLHDSSRRFLYDHVVHQDAGPPLTVTDDLARP